MAAESELDVTVKGIDELSPELSAIESRLIRFVGAVSSAIAAIKIGSFPIQAAADFQTQLQNVQKTTNFTTDQINQLSAALLDLSLRTSVSATDLGKIAAAAGQQGLGTTGVKGITEFTDSVSRMADVLDVTAEEAATNIGQILNIFKLPINEIEKAVSTFNQVSNNSVASGEKLLDVVKRIGDAGGSLQFSQVVGLAASGIGFGQSPEVVGSAISNVFAKLKEKAGEVGKVLNMSATDWLKILNTDGIAGFKLYLDGLRKLDQQSQVTAIAKITGGGRQGVLLQKFVQDTTNSLLDKNQRDASDGFTQGTSAIREQQTVLMGFQKQVNILYNSIFKLGAETGQTLLPQLTAYAAQLGQAFQSEGVKQFVGAVVGSFGDLVGALASTLKFIGSLNVNWENFIKVAEVFVGLKLGQTVNTLVGNLTGLNNISAKIAGTQLGLVDSLKQAWQDTKAASGVQALQDKYTAYNKTLEQTAALEAEVGAARQRADAAATAEAGTATAARGGLAATQGAASAVATQRAAVTAAQQQAAQNEAAIEASRQASIARSQATFNANQLAIEQTYQNERQAIRDTGTRVGLTALNREYAAQNDQNQQQLARSLAGVEQYWNQRLAFVQQASQREVAIQLNALQQEQANLEAALARQSTLDGAHAAASGAANAANAELTAAMAAQEAAATQSVSVWARIRTAGTVALQGIGAGINLLRTGLVALAGVATKAFLWVTILYSIADALGLVDKLTGSFQAVTDALGLTSAAQRDAKVAADAHSQTLEKQKKALDELTESYKKNLDAQTGTITTDRAQAAARQTTEGDQNQRDKARSNFTDLLQGAQATQGATGGAADQQLNTALTTKIAQLKDLQAKIADLTNQVAAANDPQLQGLAAAAGAVPVNVDTLTTALAAAQKQAADTAAQITTLQNGLAATPAAAQNATTSLTNLNAATATLFTTASANAFQQFVAPMGDAVAKAQELKTELETAQQATKAFTPDDNGAAATDARQRVADLDAAFKAANLSSDAAADSLRKFVAQQQAVPGLDPKVLASFLELLTYIKSTPEAIAALSKSIASVQGAGLPFTGQNAGVNPPKPSTGTGKYTPGNKSADSLAKAQFELQKAQLQATFNLQKEHDSQMEAQADDLYNRGLESLTKYYSDRQTIQLSENANEQTMLRKQLDALAQERKDATSDAAKVRVDANVAQVKGQIAVLQAQRQGIQDQTKRDQRAAQETFNDMVATQTQTLISDLISPADISTVFANAFTVGLDSARKTINELRSNGNNALADQIEIGIKFKALNSVQDVISKQSTLAYDAINNLQAKLSAAQTQGALTSQEAEFELNNAIAARIPLLEQQIALMEQSANAADVDKNSAAYQQLTLNIDNARVKLLQLQTQQNATAKAINSSITDSLTTALDNLQPTFASLKQTALQFLLDIGNAIKKTFAQDIAQSIMKWANGGNSSGGIGGFVASVMGKDSSNTLGANAGANGSVGLALGSTAVNPLYVSVVNSGIGLGADQQTSGSNNFGFTMPGGTASGTGNLFTMPDGTAGASKDTVDQLSQGLFSEQNTTQFFSGLSSTLGTSVNAVTSAMQGNFSGLISLLGTLFTSLITTLSAGSASSSLSGLFSSGAAAAAVAHTGGVIGGTPLRTKSVSPAVFRNAIRYHTGGVAGLQPDEVPTILRKGEEVLTANDPRHRANGGANGTNSDGSGGSGLNIRNVLVSDPNFVPDSMNSASGEKVIMTFLTKNKQTLKQMLK